MTISQIRENDHATITDQLEALHASMDQISAEASGTISNLTVGKINAEGTHLECDPWNYRI